MTEQLDDSDRALLAFEARWPRHSGAKEEAIRVELALAPARYYLLLDRLIETEPALQHDPLLVRRLRRLREDGERRRAARMIGTSA